MRGGAGEVEAACSVSNILEFKWAGGLEGLGQHEARGCWILAVPSCVELALAAAPAAAVTPKKGLLCAVWGCGFSPEPGGWVPVVMDAVCLALGTRAG